MNTPRVGDALLAGFVFGALAVTILVSAYWMGHDAGRHSLPVACEAMPTDTITRGTR